MSIGNTKDNGNKGNNLPYQLAVLQLLDQINTSIGVIPGVDYETRTTTYQATANGAGYSIGDIIVRYDIIDVATSTVSSTIWFNQTTQTVIAAPVPGNLTPYLPPGNVTVTNPFNLEATQQLIRTLLTTINADTSNLDVLLSTRASEATLASRASEATSALIKTNTDNLDVALSTRATEATLAALNAKLNSLGQKLSAASAPVVLSTEQEVILNAIKTAVENIDADLGTGGLATEATLQAVQTLITSTNALLTTIDADTSNLDVLLSTRASEVTLQAVQTLLTTIDGVLDSIKVDTGALVVDLAAIEVLITTTNSLLTTIDGVLDTIKLDTANLDVALSTRASEATLSTINTILSNTLDVLLSSRLSTAAFEARINTLGQKTMAESTPVVMASDQSAIPVTLPAAVSRTPSVVEITSGSAGSTIAGVKELSILVIGNGNTVGGVSVPSGTVLNYVARQNDTIGALAYTTGGGSNRLILTYLT